MTGGADATGLALATGANVSGCQRCFKKTGYLRLPNHPAPRRCRECMVIEKEWAKNKGKKEIGGVKKEGEEEK